MTLLVRSTTGSQRVYRRSRDPGTLWPTLMLFAGNAALAQHGHGSGTAGIGRVHTIRSMSHGDGSPSSKLDCVLLSTYRAFFYLPCFWITPRHCFYNTLKILSKRRICVQAAIKASDSRVLARSFSYRTHSHRRPTRRPSRRSAPTVSGVRFATDRLRVVRR